MRRCVSFLLGVMLAINICALADASSTPAPITLTASSGHVEVGDEEQLCHQRTFPRSREMDVNRIVMKVKGGSHHVHLYRPYNGDVVYPPLDCPFAVDFNHWQLVAATQTPLLDWQLPPGVGINFGPRQPLLIQ